MFRLDHHRHAVLFHVVPDALRHLRRQPFLDLQAPRKPVEQAAQLGDAHRAETRQVRGCR